ncbi:sensor histidine kinase [Ancylobacter sp. A5.8]|uniref:sensor histidine kinase n=1 Tax=Ancylobacter gelatini TaxID=2919920 RepID=UPI001F4E4A69|nr:PAS domain-containing sensor histidine kinase [Ancylobacter gelatini]MCJ8144624.1 sensor histidine kinase [Ancylobacter gelatini]
MTTSDGAFPHGDSDMVRAVRAFDWSSTPLGPIEEWPPTLRITVDMMLNSAFPKCLVWGPECTAIYNDAFRPILGKKSNTLGRSFLDIWSEVRDEIAPILDSAFAGRATFIEDFPLVIERNGYPEPACFTFCYSPVYDEEGQVCAVMDTVIETTGKIDALRSVELLNSELQHRIKNMLAMIVGIANQTFRNAEDKDNAHHMLIGRLQALDNAQSILVNSRWQAAPIHHVVAEALRPHDVDGRLTIEGPALHLSARQSLALSLALHELATNAVKYGALSTPSGAVRLSWNAGTPGTEQLFRLHWEEKDGPLVQPPQRRGFGSRLVERALSADFGGQVEVSYDPAGVRVELMAPMLRLGLGEPADPASPS